MSALTLPMSFWITATMCVEQFDLVIFMGVLYHLRHSLLALDLIYEHAAHDLLLFQSMQRGSALGVVIEEDYPFSETAVFDEQGFPRMHFVEDRYSGDHTNWWIPNRAGAEAMLRSAGFEIVAHPEEEVYLCHRTGISPAGPLPHPFQQANPPNRRSKL